MKNQGKTLVLGDNLEEEAIIGKDGIKTLKWDPKKERTTKKIGSINVPYLSEEVKALPKGFHVTNTYAGMREERSKDGKSNTKVPTYIPNRGSRRRYVAAMKRLQRVGSLSARGMESRKVVAEHLRKQNIFMRFIMGVTKFLGGMFNKRQNR